MTTSIRYRFGEFVLSPRQRVLWRHGAPVDLIPKYFDVLCLLIRRRHEAVSKQAIFTEVTREAAARASAQIQKGEAELTDEVRKKGLQIVEVNKKSFIDAVLKSTTPESMGFTRADFDKMI